MSVFVFSITKQNNVSRQNQLSHAMKEMSNIVFKMIETNE